MLPGNQLSVVGRSHLVAENSFYGDFVKVMTSAPFRHFCTKYMKTWSDIEAILLYVKLYEMFDNLVNQDPSTIISVIDCIMNDNNPRRKAIDIFRDF